MKRIIAISLVILFSTAISARVGSERAFSSAEEERLEMERELEKQIKRSREIIELKRPQKVMPEQPKKLERAAIEVLSPNGGETWYKGYPYSIRWTSKGVRGNVKIMLMYGPGSEGWYVINENASNTGSYTFTVPTQYLDGKYLYEEPNQYMIYIIARDQQVADGSDGRFSIVSPPDLEIKDAYFRSTPSGKKLFFEIQNNGGPMTQTPVNWRIAAYYPLRDIPLINGETSHTVTLRSGERKFIETGISQPDPLYYTLLKLGMELDWRNEIPESNEDNNVFEKTILLPCGARINGIDNTTVKWVEEFKIYGSFGNRGTKLLYAEKIADKEVRSGNPVGEKFWIPVRLWTGSALYCAIPPDYALYGDYKLYVCCTDPSAGDAYKSNSIDIFVDVVIRGSVDWSWLGFLPLQEEVLDPRKLADALSEELSDELNFDNSPGSPLPPAAEIKNIWMEPAGTPSGSPTYYLHCDYDCRLDRRYIREAMFEIYKGETRLPLYMRSDVEQIECHAEAGVLKKCHAKTGVYWALRPGEYDIKCTVRHLAHPTDNKVSSSVRVVVP